MKLETSRDISLPKVKDRLCLLKIDRIIQTDFGIQLNVVLFSFFLEKKKQLNLAALKCHHDQLPPTYSPQISKLKIFCSSHMMMKMKMLTRVEHGKGLVLVIT